MGDDPEMGAADISLTEEEAELLISLGERLQSAMEGDMGDEDEDEPMSDMDDMGDDEVDLGDMGDEDEDAPGGGGRYGSAPMMEEEDQEEIVNEVLRRVTKRIIKESLNSK